MKIEKKDVLLVVACALGGFILVVIAIPDPFTAIVAGIPSGALGGCVACIFRHFVRSKSQPKEQA